MSLCILLPNPSLNSKGLHKWRASLPTLYPDSIYAFRFSLVESIPAGPTHLECPLLFPSRSYQAHLHSCVCASAKDFLSACSVQLPGRQPGPGDKIGTVSAPKELQEETHQQDLWPELVQAKMAVSAKTGNSL